jgi:hypothetical protein
MNTLLVLAGLFIGSPSVCTAVDRFPFRLQHCGADGIVVGRIAAVQERTIDIDTQEWIRDRTGGKASRIRTNHFSLPSFMGGALEPYRPGTRLLLLLTRPFSEWSEGKNTEWLIITQHELEGRPVCADPEDLVGGLMFLGHGECVTSVSETALLDAMRSFEECFRVNLDEASSCSVERMCPVERAKSLSSRSALHKYLVEAAMMRVSDQE